MIASHTPPKKDHRKPAPLNGGSANGKPLSNPSLSLPMGAGPAPEENGSSPDSSRSDRAFASREAGGPPTIRLHPRFRNSAEDERDDPQGAKDRRSSKPIGVVGEAAVGRVEIRPFVAPRQQPPPVAPRPASWSSWTAPSNGSQARGGPTWRLHFRTDSDDVATAVPPAAVASTSVLRFHPASSLPISARETGTELQSVATLSENEYQRLLHQHSQHAAQHRRPHVRPASAPAGSSSIATRHYSSWQQWNGQPGLAIGGRNFVQQSRARSGPPPPRVYTSVRPQLPDLHGPPLHLHSTFVGRTPPNSSTGPSVDGSRPHAMPVDNNEALPSKRLMSPDHQQHSTPLFKKARGFDKLDLLCSATLEIGELHDNPTGCSCPKSKCVALYCDCFKAGRRCNPSMCSCLDWYVRDLPHRRDTVLNYSLLFFLKVLSYGAHHSRYNIMVPLFLTFPASPSKNTIAESGVDGARTKAIRCILARNPRAFRTAGEGNPLLKLPPGEIACNCVRSRCLKLYCTCFQSGKPCRAGVCTCVGCYNTETDIEGHRKAAIEQALEKRPDAFQVKVKEKGLGCACKNNRCIKKYCDCFRTHLACTDKCTCRQCENKKG